MVESPSSQVHCEKRLRIRTRVAELNKQAHDNLYIQVSKPRMTGFQGRGRSESNEALASKPISLTQKKHQWLWSKEKRDRMW